MRISDWSSDVCSSDLPPGREAARRSRRFARVIGPAAGPTGTAPHNCRDWDDAAHSLRARRVRARMSWRSRADKRARDFHKASANRSEEHTSELQSLMRISYAVFCLKKKKKDIKYNNQISREYKN